MLLRSGAWEVAFSSARTWTSDQLHADVAALVGAMAPLPRGDRLVSCQRRYPFAVACLACWAVGDRVTLPAGAPAPDAALRSAEGVLREGIGQGITIPEGTLGLPQPLYAPPDDQVLVVLSTSGSTGQPRAWPKTAGQLLREARTLGQAFDLAPGARILATVPPHHIYGLLFSVLVPLLAGASFSDDSPLFPEAVAARLAASGASVLVSVPAHLRALSEAGVDLPVQRIFSSGAPLPAPVATALAAHGHKVTEVFGSTETGGIAWRHAVDDPRWRPLPGVTVSEEEGRLVVSSPWLPPDARPWRSDDHITLHPDGTFDHLGRLDDVVKIASIRVSLRGVEAALLATPDVRDAAVVLLEREGHEGVLHALYAGDIPPEEVRARLAERLAPVARPRLHRVVELPRDPTGKLPRERLHRLIEVRAGLVTTWQEDRAIPTELRAFEGHFPGQPILPGASQLALLVLPTVDTAWPDLGPPSLIERATFHRPVRPGDTLRVAVERFGDSVGFKVDGPEGAVCSGSLRWASPDTSG